MIMIGHVKICAAGWYVGRPSCLGNPFPVRSSKLTSVRASTLSESLLLYDAWLTDRLSDSHSSQSAEVRAMADALAADGHLTLLCWCSRELREAAPLQPSCHADLIAGRVLAAVSELMEARSEDTGADAAE